ncbi:MAG: hypothetical protein HN368_10515 [Spirochaetales bacterium]|jgi:hypothetical protein|nr:hypothetical protein [Spirochaetales bacterium]
MTKRQEWDSWKTYIDKAIATTCIGIIKEPLLYFSEADFQQLLVEELRRIEPFTILYPTAVHKGKDSKAVYKTSLIHREYGGTGGRRLDVTLFDPVDVATITDINLTAKGEYLKPVFAVELGTEKTSDAEIHLSNDIQKLQDRVLSTGYIVHFYKDTTRSPSGTKQRSQTEDKIYRVFKDVFTRKKTASNIKLLAIVLRVYRNQKRMWGKCEIFNGTEWEKVGVENDTALLKKILTQLD